MNEQTTAQQSVLSASYRGRQIYFTDFVREGDHVEVYRTFEEAEDQRGHRITCVVRRRRDDWWLEELPARASVRPKETR